MTLPSSPQAEQALLACILFDSEIHEDLFDVCATEMFYSERHQQIFNALKNAHLKRDHVDLVTSVTLPDIISGNHVGYLTEIADKNSSVMPSMWETYAMELQRLSCSRSGIKAAKEIMDSLSKGVDAGTAIDEAQSIIMGLDSSIKHSKQYHAMDLARESMSRYKLISQGDAIPGIPTGYRELDDIFGGGLRNKFIIVAGRPGQGKTAIAVNMAYHQAMRGHNVAILSLEMGRDEVWDRFVSIHGRINQMRLSSGRFNPADWSKIVESNSKLSSLKITIDDSSGGIPVSEVRSICRRLKKRGAEIIYIDQLSKIRGPGKSLFEQNTHVVNDLSPLCKELSIPIVLLAQINREAMNNGVKKPSMHNLKQTGSLEEDADIVMIIHREYEYTRDDSVKDEAIIDIAKHRGGPTAEIKMRWTGKYTRLDDWG